MKKPGLYRQQTVRSRIRRRKVQQTVQPTERTSERERPSIPSPVRQGVGISGSEPSARSDKLNAYDQRPHDLILIGYLHLLPTRDVDFDLARAVCVEGGGHVRARARKK